MPQEIEINIDRLILQGVEPGNTKALKAAIREALTALIRQNGWSEKTALERDNHRIDAGAIRLNKQSNANQLGSQIAQQIYTSINKPG